MARFVKRGTKWQYEVSYKKDDGSYDKIRKGGFRTKGDAKVEATEIENQLNKGYKPDKKNILLSDHFENWMTTFKEIHLDIATFKEYRTTLNNIKKYAQFVTLGDLTTTSYQEILNRYAEGRVKGTVKRFHNHIHASLLTAIDDKILTHDPARKPVINGTEEEQKDSEKFLEYSDFKKVVKAAESRLDVRYTSPYMIVLGAATGARFSELLGLTWEDIDLSNQFIDINKTWKQSKKDFGLTKNPSSVRVVDFDDHTADIFRSYKIEQQKYLDLYGLENPRNLIFFNMKNGAISANAVNKTLKKIQDQLSIEEPITFHGLRHTFASTLLYHGIDIMTVSEILGHKDTSITQKVYSHVLDEMRQRNRVKVSKVISSIYD